MAEKAENKAAQFSECPKCRKKGYRQSKDFYSCRYCGYTAPDIKGKQEHDIAFNKLDHGTKPGGLRY
jgi:ribosomal protein L37AE/L43A